MESKTVRVLSGFGKYCRGDIATLETEKADMVVAKGYATPYHVEQVKTDSVTEVKTDKQDTPNKARNRMLEPGLGINK